MLEAPASLSSSSSLSSLLFFFSSHPLETCLTILSFQRSSVTLSPEPASLPFPVLLSSLASLPPPPPSMWQTEFLSLALPSSLYNLFSLVALSTFMVPVITFL